MTQTNTQTQILNSFEDTFFSDPDEQGQKKELTIPSTVVRGIYSAGFEKPTDVQKSAILPIVIGRDALIQAQSGTGKTGAFTIGALSRIDWSQPTTQVLFLAPSMNLIRQIGQVVSQIGQYCSPDNTDWFMICYGGGNKVENEIKSLRSGRVKIVIGTPGRVSHLIRERAFGKDLRLIVFDEIDSLLENRFLTEINSYHHQHSRKYTNSYVFSHSI